MIRILSSAVQCFVARWRRRCRVTMFLSPSCSMNLSPVVVLSSSAAATTIKTTAEDRKQQPAPPGCSCPSSWLANTTMSPSPSPSSPLATSYFDHLDYPDANLDPGSYSCSGSATSPIAVTGPPLAHAPYLSQAHLSVPPVGPAAGATAHSLPQQFYLPNICPGTGVTNGPYSPSPFMFGEISYQSSNGDSIKHFLTK